MRVLNRPGERQSAARFPSAAAAAAAAAAAETVTARVISAGGDVGRRAALIVM
jgi:hypothetical protein